MMEVGKYSDIKVAIIGGSGNAFSIIGAVMDAMRKAHKTQAERDAILAEMASGDYDHLLRTVTLNFTVTKVKR